MKRFCNMLMDLDELESVQLSPDSVGSDFEDTVPVQDEQLAGENLGEIDLEDTEEIPALEIECPIEAATADECDELSRDEVGDEDEITTQESFGEELPTEEFPTEKFPKDKTRQHVEMSEIDFGHAAVPDEIALVHEPGSQEIRYDEMNLEGVGGGEEARFEQGAEEKPMLEVTEDTSFDEITFDEAEQAVDPAAAAPAPAGPEAKAAEPGISATEAAVGAASIAAAAAIAGAAVRGAAEARKPEAPAVGIQPPPAPAAEPPVAPSTPQPAEAENALGNSPLLEAVRGNHLEIAKLLLEQGADPNHKNATGDTPLISACRAGYEEMARLLLAGGADPRIANRDGDTPLHVGARNGNAGIVRLLRSSGAVKADQTTEIEDLECVSGSNQRALLAPLLYPDMVQFCLKEIGTDGLSHVVKNMAPEGARGTDMEIFMEIFYHYDPPVLIKRIFGEIGTRNLARTLGYSQAIDEGRNPLELVLAHFGLSLFYPTQRIGFFHTRSDLEQLESTIQKARETSAIRGAFLDGCLAVEHLVRISMWGWAELVFGVERDSKLFEALRSRGQKKYHGLEGLTFGDISKLFATLPDLIAASNKSELLEQKFGTRIIYSPRDPKTNLESRLRRFVNMRNRAAHNREYWKTRSLVVLRKEHSEGLKGARDLLEDMIDSRAIPELATAVEERRDQWNRFAYRFMRDDGSFFEAYFWNRLLLGNDYLYFGSSANPIPVEPLVLKLPPVAHNCH